MVSKKYWFIKQAVLFSIFIMLFSITSFAEQIYYYSYTTREPDRIPYRDQNHDYKPIIVIPNNNDTYTLIDGDVSEVLAKNSLGNYTGGFDEYYILNNNGLNLSGGISDDYYSLTPFTEGWINPDNDKWYYLGADGKTVTNQWVGNYYLGSDGIMMTNSWTPDGYYVGADGAWNSQPALLTNNNFQTTTQNNSISYMTLSGNYTAMTHLSRFDTENDIAYIHDIEINGDTLTLKGTLDYIADYSYLPGRLKEGVYNFQLNSDTEYGEIENDWIPMSKADFEQLVARRAGPCINVVVENDVVSSVSFSA